MQHLLNGFASKGAIVNILYYCYVISVGRQKANLVLTVTEQRMAVFLVYNNELPYNLWLDVM